MPETGKGGSSAPHKILYILRGLPGSGKSTLCQQMLSFNNGVGAIFSTDDYFLTPGTKKGKPNYAFDPSKLSEAHAWNEGRALEAFQGGITPVFIDNTHVARWEARFYLVYGLRYGYQVVFLEPQTKWWLERDLKEMAKRNSHGVTLEKLERMLSNWEDDFTVQNVMWAQRKVQRNSSSLTQLTGSHSNVQEGSKVVIQDREPQVSSAVRQSSLNLRSPAALEAKPLRNDASPGILNADISLDPSPSLKQDLEGRKEGSTTDLLPEMTPVQIIIAMGFPERAVHAALGATNDNVDRALALLLDTDVSNYLVEDGLGASTLPEPASVINDSVSHSQSSSTYSSMEELVSQLLPLGVKREDAVKALKNSKKNVQLAASTLFND